MGNYRIVLFDLDGTLTDPKIGITKSVQYALQKMGIFEPDLEKLVPFIGPPLQETFSVFYSFDEQQVAEAIGYYRERYGETGMYENELFPEIPDLLAALQQAGMILVVATSKPTFYAEKILEHFHISQFFQQVVGSNLDGTRSAKAEIIAHILEQFPQTAKSDFIMIGDRKHDLIGASRMGIDSIGVTYGYGSREELSRENPTYIVDSIADIGKILLAKISLT